MLIELTNKYTKDLYSRYEERCDKHYVKKEDILRISNEYGEDIESYWKDRYKYNYYCYINENGETKKLQIDYDTFIKLQTILGDKVFITLTITYIFIILISLYGDYKSKEIEKQKEEWEEIVGKKYY